MKLAIKVEYNGHFGLTAATKAVWGSMEFQRRLPLLLAEKEERNSQRGVSTSQQVAVMNLHYFPQLVATDTMTETGREGGRKGR